MSLLKKVQQRSVERKFGGTHPILRMGLDRNAVDAYFMGLVFAAVADDETIDKFERQKLARIGSALNIPEEDARSMMTDMLARDSDAKIAIAEECANVLKGSPSIPLFVCEWSQVWMSHNYKQEELEEFRRQLCEWLGVECDTNFCSAFDTLISGATIDEKIVQGLMDKITEEDLVYLCAERADEIRPILDAIRAKKENEAQEKKKREAAKQREMEAKRREEQKKIDAENAIHQAYDKLCRIAHGYVEKYGEHISRQIFSQLQDEVVEILSEAVDYQAMFLEIGRRFVSRISELKIPDLQWRCSFLGSKRVPTYMDDSDLKQDDIDKLENAKMCARETVWILFGLASRKISVSDLRIDRSKELLRSVFCLEFVDPKDVASIWGDQSSYYFDGDFEGFFRELLDLQSVRASIFQLTEEQRSQCCAWWTKTQGLKGKVKSEDFLAFAHSIGVPRYFSVHDLLMAVRADKSVRLKAKE